MFYPDSNLKAADIQDGTSYTLCAAEVKAWQPYYRNGGWQGSPNNIPSDLSGLGGEFKPDGGHTEWVDGRVHQTGFTTAFRPNSQEMCNVNGTTYDVDWTSQQEGKSTTVSTYAAVTARSSHGGGVNALLMDGSVRWITNEVNLGVWRAYSTRAGGEIISNKDQGQ